MVKTKYFRNIFRRATRAPPTSRARALTLTSKQACSAAVDSSLSFVFLFFRSLAACGTLLFVNGNQIVCKCVCFAPFVTHSLALSRSLALVCHRVKVWRVLGCVSVRGCVEIEASFCEKSKFVCVSEVVLRNGMFCVENFAVLNRN